MKKCTRCKEILSLDNFRKDTRNTRNGYKSRCKKCLKELSDLQKLRFRSFKNKPCMDCGKMYPWYVMDYDHRNPESKEFGISAAFGGHYSDQRILNEINKCDLICSNCHRERTYKHKIIKN